MHTSLRALGLLAVLVMSFLVGPSVGRFSTAVVAELYRNGALHDVVDAFGNIAYAASQLQGAERPGSTTAAQDAPASPDPATQAAETAARITQATAPLAVADFAGTWGRHGFGMTINPDGTAEAAWRVYDWCKDTGGRQPCDDVKDGTIVPGGRGTLRFDRTDYRTLIGTVVTSSDERGLPLGPIQLTEYDYGLAELVNARGLQVGPDQRTMREADLLGGPRYQQAPPWVRRMSPLGA